MVLESALQPALDQLLRQLQAVLAELAVLAVLAI
jgi:hypothetical protein